MLLLKERGQIVAKRNMSTEPDKSIIVMARGAGIILIGLIIGNLLNIINQILLTRFLGPSDYGIFNISISIITIIGTLASLGLVGALSVCIARHLENIEILIKIVASSFKLVFISSLLGAIMLWMLSDVISLKIFHNIYLAYILRIVAIFVPFLVLSNISQAILRAFSGAKHKVYIYDIAAPLTKSFIFIFFIFVGNWLLLGAMMGYIVGIIISLSASIVLINKNYIKFISSEREILSIKENFVGRALLRFSWPLALTGATYLFISKTDILLLGYYMSSDNVGIYSAALNIALMLTLIGQSVEWIFLPTISKYFVARKSDELKSLFQLSSKWMIMIIYPCFLYIWLFSSDIIRLFFGPEYLAGRIALIILAFGFLVNLSIGLAGNMLVASGCTKLNLLSEMVGGITNILINIILIPIYGIEGAAIGTSLSYIIRSCSALFFVYMTSKLHPFRISDIKILLVGGVVLILVYLIKTCVFRYLIWQVGLILIGLILVTIYMLLILFANIIDENDKLILKSLVQRGERKNEK